MHPGDLLKRHWFSISMILCLVIAGAWPGASHAVGTAGWPRSTAIAIVFFITGLQIRPQESLAGLANWRLHVAVQAVNFVALPLITWLALRPAQGMAPGLVMGFLALAAVPTTISSNVVMTSIARGNVAGALFNAVFGNLSGIVISPALLIVLAGAGELALEVDTQRLVTRLISLIVLPLAAGQVVRFSRGTLPRSVSKSRSIINRICILFIMYSSLGGVFLAVSAAEISPAQLAPLALLIPAHLVLLWVAWGLGRILRYDRGERIAFLFCAPQKTLALAFPLIDALTESRPELIALAGLPIIVYHATQLIVGGIVADRLGRS